MRDDAYSVGSYHLSLCGGHRCPMHCDHLWYIVRYHLIFQTFLIRPPEQSGNCQRYLVENQEKLGEEMIAEFCLRSISFIHFGFFNMPYIYDMGPPASLPLRGKSCYVFLSSSEIHRPRPGLNPQNLDPMATTLSTDHGERILLDMIDGDIFDPTDRK